MKYLKKSFLIVVVISASVSAMDAATLENNRYRLQIEPDGTVVMANKKISGTRRFAPRFSVLWRSEDPKFTTSLNRETAYQLPTWNAVSGGEKTQDFFAAGELFSVRATGAESSGDTLHWRFPENEKFSFRAELNLPAGNAEPKVTFYFTPKIKAWYSIGYTGAPEVASGEFDSIWQPLVWQEKRFPRGSFLSDESMCSVPAVLVNQKNSTFGVVADPARIPFRQATHRNSLFGVLLRNQEGNAQPMIFAPLFGLPDSSMDAGKTFSFSFQFFIYSGDTIAAYRNLAREVFGFRDYRQNGACSLNETLENMIDYAMNDQFCGWLPEQKGSDYSTDVPGSVKNVSALHPLSIALITDNKEIYTRRGLPMTEYMLSRQKYLFAPREGIRGQSASHLMKGPAAEVSELAALHGMFQGNSEIFRHHAVELFDKPRALNLDMVSEAGSWQNALAVYRVTGKREFLEKAIAGANDYITARIDVAQEDFSDAHVDQGGQFWTDFAPKWVDLFELYEETKDPRHLKAAVAGANSYATFVRMQPSIPPGDFLSNKGGKVGVYYASRISNPQPMRAPEQRVPAWRVSPIGLTSEATTTYGHNPAILLSHYAAYMLRLGHLTDDSFFHDIGRAAVVGRYATFPGYGSKGEYTTIYQRPDYPLRPWRELTYNNIFFNHVWPNIALVMDFLVSDSFVKSDGEINFPSRYAQGYAFLQSKVYGDRAGTFYGDENIRLWLPAKLLRTDTIQANYVAGYGNNNFYIALLNQSPQTHTVTITLNPDVVPVNVNQTYPVQIWRDNKPSAAATLRNGKLTVPLSAHGITALKIEGLKVASQFQDQVFASGNPSKESFAIQETEFGKVTSMLLSMGPALTSGYIWLDATPKQVSQATIHIKRGEVITKIVDAIYPFEFSVPLNEKETTLECWVEAVTADGKTNHSDPVNLKR